MFCTKFIKMGSYQVDKYNENDEIKRHNRKPVAYKVHKDQVKFILDEIKSYIM